MALEPIGDIADATLTESAAIEIIDDFEDGDISEYTGSTGRTTVVTSTVFNGTYSLEHDTPADGKYPIISTSGLANYPEAGDTFRVYFYTPSSNYVGIFGFAQQGNTVNTGSIICDEGGYAFEIRNSSADGVINWHKDQSQPSSSSVSDNLNAWNYIEIAWGSGGMITAEVRQANDDSLLGDITVSDSSYASGGVLWGQDGASGTTATSYFDYVHVP